MYIFPIIRGDVPRHSYCAMFLTQAVDTPHMRLPRETHLLSVETTIQKLVHK